MNKNFKWKVLLIVAIIAFSIWKAFPPSEKINLGLDLSGGMHIALEVELDKIPAVVMNTLKSKFPEAEIHKWSKEKEGDIVLYDIEFKQHDQKFEADIKEDGTIQNWEKEIME